MAFNRLVEDAQLNELCEAPESFSLVIQGGQEGGQEVCHPLTVADVSVVDHVVEEDVPMVTMEN